MITPEDLLRRRRHIVSRSLFARVDRVEAQGRAYAVKRFEARMRSAWASEVASHLICPQPEVVALLAYGLDDSGRPWLATPWVEKRPVRYWIKKGHPELQNATEAWIDQFQARLSLCGYRWYDATSRNLLVGADQLTNPRPDLKVVDYVLLPIRHEAPFTECVARVETMLATESIILDSLVGSAAIDRPASR